MYVKNKLKNRQVLATVVYQKPKLSAETERFQLSAFGFGRRKKTLNMAEILEKPIFLSIGNFLYSVKPVVDQKPKLSAETKSFQLSAFGFGRRN